MKYVMMSFLCVVLSGCSDPLKKPASFYKAVQGEKTGCLYLSEERRKFYGSYEVRYGLAAKDSGTVSGVIKGDTLRGIYKYVSYGGSETSRPIIFLRDGNNLILGKGSETSYLGIPYYIPETIVFNKKGFYFYPIQQSRTVEP